MGARQSKRSVDITTTPKKGDGDAVIGEEKIEKLGDADVKAVVTNGAATHTDIEFADKDEEAKESEEKPTVEIKENGLQESSEGEKTPDKEAVEAAGDQPTKPSEDASTPENAEKVAETPDSKKQKEKKKKKWSLRSISFSKKDKSKPGKEKEKNGEVEEINEENAEQTATTPIAETAKADESKTPVEEVTETPVTNGSDSKEELVVKVPEAIAEVETEKVKTPEESAPAPAIIDAPKEEPKADEPVAQEKVEENDKPAIEEPKPASDETSVVQAAVEEVKEVRSEEIPPPLPSSNPPSQVTVFAESTKANVLSADDEISISEKPELPVAVSLSPSEQIQNPTEPLSPKVETAAVESVPVTPVESEEANIKIRDDIESATDVTPCTEKGPESVIPSPMEVARIAPMIASVPDVEFSDLKQTVSSEQNESASVDSVLITESSPLIVEALPKQSGESLQDISSGVTLEGGDSSVSRNESETSNLSESKQSNDVESGQISLKTDDDDAVSSVPSVPALMEEKMPVVSSEGDMLNPLDSQTSLQSDGDELQELISNLNLKDSPTSQEPSLISEPQSDILSTIPEVDSKELKLEEDNSSNSSSVKAIDSALASGDQAAADSSTASSQKDVEPVCNADSLPDLSTESLPSLPEPTDSLIEPMSLPPLDSVPEPLVDDNLPISPLTAKLDSTPIPQEAAPVVLTNGNATNGLKSSPNADDETPPPLPPLDGPLKQVVAPEPVIEEKSQTPGDAPVESVQSAPVAAE